MKITTSEKSAADSIRSQRVFDVRTCTVRIVPFFLNSKVAGKTAKKNIIHMHTFVTSPRGRTDARRVDHAGNRNRRTDAPSEIRPEPGGVSDWRARGLARAPGDLHTRRDASKGHLRAMNGVPSATTARTYV